MKKFISVVLLTMIFVSTNSNAGCGFLGTDECDEQSGIFIFDNGLDFFKKKNKKSNKNGNNTNNGKVDSQYIDPTSMYFVYDAVGYWLSPDSDEHYKLYGETIPSADWRVVQWNRPSYDLPAFSFDGEIWETSNDSMAVKFDGKYTTISQDGTYLRCNQEFDAFVSPNLNENIYKGVPQAAEYKDLGVLSEVNGIIHRIAIEPVERKVFSNTCKLKQSSAITTIVLTNRKKKQTFFYQLKLFDDTGDNTVWWWPNGRKFGFDDAITSYGYNMASVGSRSEYIIDVKPRIIELMKTRKKNGLDQNFDNWRVSGFYYGQHIWGKVYLETKWDSFLIFTY